MNTNFKEELAKAYNELYYDATNSKLSISKLWK